jgi:hypothetical protein
LNKYIIPLKSYPGRHVSFKGFDEMTHNHEGQPVYELVGTMALKEVEVLVTKKRPFLKEIEEEKTPEVKGIKDTACKFMY